MKTTLLTLSALVLAGVSFGQNPGDLDPNFGISGYAMTDPIANTGEHYWDLITLNDDKIIKVGYTDDGNDTDILVGKFLADGTPDSTFATNGFATIDLSLGGDEDARGAVELPSGQLLITGFVQTVGSFDAFVMRMNADGTIDTSFGTSSGHTKMNTGDNTIAYGKTVISNGSEIYVGGAAIVNGQSDLFICNLTQGGGIDNSFSSGGYATMDIEGGNDQMLKMDVKANGSFVFGGTADSSGTLIGYVASLSQFGTPATFGTNGKFNVNFGNGANEVNDLYVDGNDNIIVAGDEGTFPNVNGFVLKLTSGGALNGTFGTNGVMMSDPGATTALFFRGVMETLDGGIIAVGNLDGTSQDMYAMLLSANGSPNSNFGGNGDVIIPFAIQTTAVTTMACALQSDGKIILGGFLESQDFVGANGFMVRLFPYVDLSSVEEIASEEFTVYPNPTTETFKIDAENINRVTLIGLNGQSIHTWEPQVSYTLPVGINSGVYFIQVETETSIGLARIIVK